MSKTLISSFTNGGVPATGLSPTIRVREMPSNALVVTDAAMTEVGDGFYSYDFTTYDSTLEYAIRFDGTATLPNAERYKFAGNESYADDGADAVWDAELLNNVIPGSFGAEVATKADLNASAENQQVVATNGSIQTGTLISGTYLTTQVLDSTYWIIQEIGASPGIIVEIDFNLPGNDSLAGVINLHGKYSGTPALLHFQQLWAWNVNTSSFELLDAQFMNGNQATDQTYTHEYYERHIDRNNNNEVKIQIRHNPVIIWIPAHQLEIDFIEATSVKVITAAEIAEAVWNADEAKRVLSLMHENMLVDNPVYDNDNNLIQARVRLFPTKADLQAETNSIGTYTFGGTGDGPGKFTVWQQVRDS